MNQANEFSDKTSVSPPAGRAATGMIFNIQKYSVQDGPGIRTTIFLKGCPLCCQWCHNPESISPRREIIVVSQRCTACGECRDACPFGESLGGEGPLPPRLDQCTLCAACVDACPTGARQMIGREMTVAEVVAAVATDRIFYEDSGGGVTISGGEPLAQPRFLLALTQALGAAGLPVALDTTGFGATENLLAAAAGSALVLYDLKAFDEARHRQLTGVSNRTILANLQALNEVHRNVWIRLPVVPGFNDDLVELAKIAAFVAGLRSVTLVNLLPFHRSALQKYARLGRAQALEGVEAPSAEVMNRAAEMFRRLDLPVKIGG
jgi:pyruvate formate lyase activating enzyme